MIGPEQILSASEVAWWVWGILVLIIALQMVWALFIIVLTWGFRRVLGDIEANTKATVKVAEGVNSLNVLLAGHYATRPDLERAYERIAAIERDVAGIEARLDVRRNK